MLDRRNPEATHGVIEFPTNLRSTGEGGVSVFAVWPVVDNAVCAVDVVFYPMGTILDPWFDDAAQAKLREVLENSTGSSSVPELAEDPLSDNRIRVSSRVVYMSPEVARGVQCAEELLLGQGPCVPVSGAVYLGSSGGSWYDDEADEYWCADKADLTEKGRTLIQALEELYGGPCRLMTVLDT